MLNYEQVAARFPQFTTPDTIKQAVIAQIAVMAEVEVNSFDWQISGSPLSAEELKEMALNNLLLCKLYATPLLVNPTGNSSVDGDSTSSSNSGVDINALINSGSIDSIAIDEETTVKFNNKQDEKNLRLAATTSGQFCAAYQQLKKMVLDSRDDIGLLYFAP
jgi:hypothetical protein